ncbi:MAG TPA: DNA polymerase III subunit chi [Nitrosospira sp.]|jgi:DNA polymerase-3 subunit chi
MTEIDFYSGAGDKLNIACRLVAKAYRKGHRVMIYSSDERLVQRFDELLWAFAPTDFVPHCQSGNRLAETTPVIVGSEPPDSLDNDVLINLDLENPPFFSRFQRLIEVTGSTPEDTQAARKRYRFYQDRGYPIRHHKVEAYS